ncbi:MAG: molybdopterin molybdotransferase MoeA [Pseudomonadota bacterium]
MRLAAAQARLAEALSTAASIEDVPTAVAAAIGRILGEEAKARRDYPACDVAALDGFVFAHPGENATENATENAASDAGEPLVLSLAPGLAAPGAPLEGTLEPGRAARTLTGAAIPIGADTVVAQEAVSETVTGSGEAALRFSPPTAGANRRRRAEVAASGEIIAPSGVALTPQRAALLAATGVEAVRLRRRLRVATFSTGDELVGPGEAHGPADVLDSNGPLLAALLRAPWLEHVDLGRVADAPAAVAAALDQAAEAADAIITTGGVGEGAQDRIGAALEAAPEPPWVRGVAIKPGRPLSVGRWRGAPLFALPGNPVAALVCFCMVARPSLLRLAGLRGSECAPDPGVTLVSGFHHHKRPGRREFVLVRRGLGDRLERVDAQGSARLDGLAASDGLADLPEALETVRPGDPIVYRSHLALQNGMGARGAPP